MTKEIPLVSVCIQTYQHADYIKDCLEGILCQKTDFPFEILLGEDCSTDGTREICIKYAEKYPDKIRLFLHTRDTVIYINGHATGRYNFVNNLTHAKGKYIALCEGDDYWTDPNKLQKQVDFLEKNEDYSICFHAAMRLVNDALVKDTLNEKQPETTTIIDLCKNNFIHTASCVFRNNLFSELPGNFNKSPAGDYFLHLLNAQYGKIKFFNETMSVYRIHENGIWSSKSYEEQQEGSCKVFEVLIDYFDGDIKSSLLSSYIELHQSILKKYKAKNDRLNKLITYYKSGINNSYFIMEHYDLMVIFKGFILKLLMHVRSLI